VKASAGFTLPIQCLTLFASSPSIPYCPVRLAKAFARSLSWTDLFFEFNSAVPQFGSSAMASAIPQFGNSAIS